MKITMYPLQGVEIDGVSIQLGMKREVVERIFLKGEYVGKRYYYYQNEMAIDYDSDDCVEFIEFLGGVDGRLKPFIYGVSVYETEADELVRLLKEKNQGKIIDNEGGYSYSFLNISVGIYREITPESLLEMIEEMKADGIPIEGNEDLETDKRRASHWATIGIGVAEYYNSLWG